MHICFLKSGKKMKQWLMLLGAFYLVCCFTSISLGADKSTSEEQLVKELYGERIAKVKTTLDSSDDLTLAREMLMAAADSANPKRLRYLLAMEALKLTVPIGTDQSSQLAEDALELADKLIPLNPIVKCKYSLQISQSQFAEAKKTKATPDKLTKLAAKMAKRQIALADAMIREKSFDKVRAILISAKNIARVYKLYDLQDDVEEVLLRFKRASAISAQIASAQARLDRAKKNFDEDGIKSAKLALGLIYLLSAGDIVQADKYLSGTGSPYEQAVSIAAAFLKDSSKVPPVSQCNDVIKALGEAAKIAKNEQARKSIATVACQICRAFLKKHPTGIEAIRARLLLTQMEQIAGDTPESRFIKSLRANYGGLYGTIRVSNLKEKLISVSYDFSKFRQIRDWRIDSGQWSVVPAKNILGCIPINKYQRARIINRLRFRADKPLVLTYQVRGSQELTGMFTILLENDPDKMPWPYELSFVLGAFRNHGSAIFVRAGHLWSSRRIRVIPNNLYNVRIAWDGEGTVTWTINGKLLCTKQVNYRKEDIPFSSIFVSLGCRVKPAAFDNVTIQGVVLEKPTERIRRPESTHPARGGRRRFPPKRRWKRR